MRLFEPFWGSRRLPEDNSDNRRFQNALKGFLWHSKLLRGPEDSQRLPLAPLGSHNAPKPTKASIDPYSLLRYEDAALIANVAPPHIQFENTMFLSMAEWFFRTYFGFIIRIYGSWLEKMSRRNGATERSDGG